ncbi:2'-5' RNA ligase family protein [Ferruginibacter sp.]
MKDLSNTIPGYRVYEYLLVLSPHEELRNKIMGVKKDFYDKYQAERSRKFSGGKPHVTLVNYLQYEMMEDKILQHLKTIAMGYHPIKIELKDYGSFPSHTIYINITSKVPIQSLVKQIRTETQRLMKLNDDNKPHFILEPHLTIARRLLPWQYEKGWLEYSHKNFTGRFIADSMLLLKRPVGTLKYEIAKRFEFENLPVAIKQGDLFSA